MPDSIAARLTVPARTGFAPHRFDDAPKPKVDVAWPGTRHARAVAHLTCGDGARRAAPADGPLTVPNWPAEGLRSMPVPPLTIVALDATEILDSRSRPTLEVTVTLAGGVRATAGVPSGASTGSREARELRDGDPQRYGGLGVRTAVSNITGPIADALTGRPFDNLAEVDAALIDLDGTPTKSRLGANSVVGVSMAAARAWARMRGRHLWQVLSPVSPRLPVPHFNVVNGGAHAPNALDFQEFMIAPIGAPNIADALRAGSEIYSRLRGLLTRRGLSTGLGDEGGFAPELDNPVDVLEILEDAITGAGYKPGKENVAIALDPAASEFYKDGRYHVAGAALTSAELITHYEQLVEQFPIWSIEDGLAEDDWDGWRELTDRLGERVQIMGDDIFVTDPTTIGKASAEGIGNAALIKVNQIGTVTQTIDALAVCRRARFGAMVSHRSGETTDAFIADLAVASGCGQIKSGAPARGERVAKYNRLLQIAADEMTLPFGLPPGARHR